MKVPLRPLLLASGLLSCLAASAQEMEMHDHHDHSAAPPSVLQLASTRQASGTSWQPETTPMNAIHLMASGWMVMLHGNLFLGYDDQGGARGDRGFAGIGWAMAMARHDLGKGELVLHAMLSPEPFLQKKSGYPLLLQTGESVDGRPIHDRQHPHDLFMEVSALVRQPLGESLAAELYLAPSGEPALGPTAFPHRTSAESDPLAPLSHHWQDSTHISFGVVTAGLASRYLKLEGSIFNGREPDEVRTNFDIRRLDSASGRLSWNPTPELSLQASYGYLASPEELEPETSVHRFTASASFTRPLHGTGHAAVTAVFGRNAPSEGPSTSAYLVEADVDLDGTNTVFGRAELVQKTGAELVLGAERAERVYDIASFSAGYLRELSLGRLALGLGGRGSIAFVSEDLSSFYGSRSPLGGMLFVRLRPAGMPSMGEGAPHDHRH